MLTLYGIPNCDTVKKARKWLEGQQLDYRFHDFRKDGLDNAQLQQWCKQLGWEALINTRGTTWRKLSDSERQVSNSEQAIALMLANPSLIKRPVLDTGTTLHLGFKPELYQSWLQPA
ncbi:ArsC family reductase [Balneatrix alpica]|uniref:ArsC family reductase n=1 Tax=Balneatrix alpica TaxID=75684 RepID=A0ABV5ZFV3_9GAMM|nr:ArsC family reductase [Balneatrix alpica]